MDFLQVRQCTRGTERAEGSPIWHGSPQVEALAGEPGIRGSIPDLILTSRQAHGRRTAETLTWRLAPPARLIELDALTLKCRLGVSPD